MHAPDVTRDDVTIGVRNDISRVVTDSLKTGLFGTSHSGNPIDKRLYIRFSGEQGVELIAPLAFLIDALHACIDPKPQEQRLDILCELKAA